ncbi:MAG: hypothetical protein JHC93_03595 [Parachlamydiales bacterium]|nr:hypothetical protein [Parachlamydiales bacterium]
MQDVKPCTWHDVWKEFAKTVTHIDLYAFDLLKKGKLNDFRKINPEQNIYQIELEYPLLITNFLMNEKPYEVVVSKIINFTLSQERTVFSPGSFTFYGTFWDVQSYYLGCDWKHGKVIHYRFEKTFPKKIKDYKHKIEN